MIQSIAIRKAGMPSKWTLHHSLINDFYVSPSIESQLSNYYKLYWQPAHFFNEMKDGVIERQGIQYLVVYRNCNPIKIRNANQVELSFRKAKEEYQLSGYVIIRIVN